MPNPPVADALLAQAMHIAETADVTTPPGRLVLYSVSYLPTQANRVLALAHLSEHPGCVTIELTEAGRALEALDLFAPRSALPKARAYLPWFAASRRLVAAASGDVRAFVEGADRRSTFLSVELPAIMRNPAIPTINGAPKADWLRRAAAANPQIDPTSVLAV